MIPLIAFRLMFLPVFTAIIFTQYFEDLQETLLRVSAPEIVFARGQGWTK